MPHSSTIYPARNSRLITLVATLLVIAMLYFGRAVLMPIALAILLAFLLGPLVNRLERLGAGRIISVAAVTALSFTVVGVITYVVTIEALSLAESLPNYKDNIREKVRSVSAPGIFSRAGEQLREVTDEAIKATTQPDPATTQAATQSENGDVTLIVEPAPRQGPEPEAEIEEPLVVQVRAPEPNAFQALGNAIKPLLGPLGQAGLVIVFVIFMLIQREDLRDRMIALAGPKQINLTTQVIDDAAKRVSRYLLMLFIVNATYGIPVAIGLWLIGVPNAILWGVLCFVLRYIPYLGPWLGASMPVILSLAVFDNWTQPLMVMGLFVTLELISNNIVEPLLYGSQTGLTPVAVLVAAVFWTWLWGVPGLVLATPITVCIVVVGRHLPQLQWLAVLLGDQPGLPLPARVYQRLLAMDHEEVYDLAQEYLKEHTLIEWYDDVLAPALSLAERDRHEGELDADRQQSVFAGVRSLIEELAEQAREKATQANDERVEAGEAAPAAPAARPTSLSSVLIVAARDQADELAGRMLAQVLEHEGLQVEVLPSGALAAEASERVSEMQPHVVIVSALPPMAVTHARYMCRRVHERLETTMVIVGLWQAIQPHRAIERVKTCGAEAVVVKFAEVVERLRM